ncbi:MAG TPA: HD-GYP domain-containing protein [Miltoncostaea sp.]|nr:HD-GYP domain-containing protein [Miltoncostaea sp.]
MLRRLGPSLAMTAASCAVPLALLLWLGHRTVDLNGRQHFLIVVVAASSAAGAALALFVLGARKRERRAVITGGGFLAMASLLAVHGASTPGLLVGDNTLIAFAGGLTLPAGAVLLLMGAHPSARRPGPVGPLVALLAAAALAVLLVGALGMAHPHSVPAVPAQGSDEALLAVSVGIVALLIVAIRAATTVLLTRRPRDLCALIGLGILVTALVAQYRYHWGEAGFWMGHGTELLGILLVGAPVAMDAWTAVPSRPLGGDLRVVDLVAQEEAFLGRRVHALLRRLEEKDTATEGHTRRVAMLAVQVGEELDLPATRLRRLALGGILHDIGKLRVPDAILKKPAKLTDEEFAVIRRHPAWGDALLEELGFAPEVRAIVRDHHERIDGTGYPSRRTGAELSDEAMIVAVCDVYDALVSPRVYRDAWPAERALALLHDETGTAFRPDCVAALQRVLDRAPATVPAAAPAPLPVPA